MTMILPMGSKEKEELKKLIKPHKGIKLIEKEDKKIKKGEFKNLPIRS